MAASRVDCSAFRDALILVVLDKAEPKTAATKAKGKGKAIDPSIQPYGESVN